jgi:uncharacterized protein involved in exopolysaccharide biosynthesis
MATILALALVDEAVPPESALQDLNPLAIALAGAVALALAIAVVYRLRKREHEHHDG